MIGCVLSDESRQTDCVWFSDKRKISVSDFLWSAFALLVIYSLAIVTLIVKKVAYIRNVFILDALLKHYYNKTENGSLCFSMAARGVTKLIRLVETLDLFCRLKMWEWVNSRSKKRKRNKPVSLKYWSKMRLQHQWWQNNCWEAFSGGGGNIVN